MPHLRLSGQHREILGLAIPALGTLVIQPILWLTDSAIIGHWSTDALAGLGLAQTVLFTIVGLCVFLAYSTTAQVARALGSNQQAAGIRAGIDATWLGIFLGLGVGALLFALAGWLIGLFGAEAQVADEATTYLRVSAFGLPAMLGIQAATGVIRGLQDTRTPLVVTVAAAILNVPLSVVLVHLVRWGIAGAAVGTVISQNLMVGLLVMVVLRQASAWQISARPHLAGIRQAWGEGVPLLIRTVCLRIALILLSLAALRFGTAQLAAHQIAWNIWGLFANVLDALAIAAQALTGKYLGAGESGQVRQATHTMMRWGVFGGVVVALALLACSWIVPTVFTPDPQVQAALRVCLVIIVVGQPLAGFVYVLDGVLMGAGDGRYLARLALINLATFVPVILLVMRSGLHSTTGLAAVWLSWAVWYMASRAVGLWHRQRGDAWLTTRNN